MFCPELTRVSFRPPIGRASFVAWALGNMRNRQNWALTRIQRMGNILRLITEYSREERNVEDATVDPNGFNRVFDVCDEEYVQDYSRGYYICAS